MNGYYENCVDKYCTWYCTVCTADVLYFAGDSSNYWSIGPPSVRPPLTNHITGVGHVTQLWPMRDAITSHLTELTVAMVGVQNQGQPQLACQCPIDSVPGTIVIGWKKKFLVIFIFHSNPPHPTPKILFCIKNSYLWFF